jgi:hypothetical protein
LKKLGPAAAVKIRACLDKHIKELSMTLAPGVNFSLATNTGSGATGWKITAYSRGSKIAG